MTPTALETPVPLPKGPLANRPWLTFLLPFAVYGLIGSLEPKPAIETPEGASGFAMLAIPYAYYPLVYTAKIVLTTLAMLWVLPGYRTFRWRVSSLAVLVGVVGVIVWVGLCKLQLEARLFGPLGLESVLGLGQRSAYNPLAELAHNPALAYAFLAVRFFGLVVVISVIEEFFLRGFVMRFATADRWWEVSFTEISRVGLIAGTVVPMLMHPGELLAALVWFSMITWLMLRTGRLADCVVAHGVTNLLLGVYVLVSGDWWLW